MDCLTNLIKMQPPCDTEREAGVMYLTDLPQISEDALSKAIEAKNESVTQLIANKIAFAQQVIKDDVLNFYQSKVTKTRVVQSDVAGVVQRDMRLTAAEAGKFKGVVIRLNQRAFLKLYVESVSVFLDAAVTSNLLVYDIDQDKLIDTIAFTSVANELTTVDFGKYYDAKNIFIGYDSGIAGNYRIMSRANACYSCRPVCYCDETRSIEFWGGSVVDSDPIVFGNIKRSSDFHGLQITYSLECDTEKAVCLIKNQLQLPLLYKVAELLAQESIYSKRNNSAINLFKEDHKELHREFGAEYKSRMFGDFNEYAKQFKQGLIDQLTVPNDICFRCNGAIKGRVNVP